jgi:hypothetical protein
MQQAPTQQVSGSNAQHAQHALHHKIGQIQMEVRVVSHGLVKPIATHDNLVNPHETQTHEIPAHT